MRYVQEAAILEEYHKKFPLSGYFGFDIRPYTAVAVFESGERILKEGEQPFFLFYLFEGQAKVFLTHENGRVSLINFLDAPCMIGEMELLEVQKAANGVVAMTACTCYAIRADQCREKLLNDTKFLRYLCRFLGKKAAGNTDKYMRNQVYPLKVRLAGFILLTSQGGFYREKHTEAAEYLGVTYRHLLYVLADFVKQGILEKTKQGYRIADAGRLREAAKE